MNFNQGQLFTLTTDDSKTLTYRIQTITDDGRLLVHSSLLEESYFITAKAFGDFLRVIGWQEEKPVKYILRFLTLTPITSEHETFDEALRVAEKIGDGWAFQIELGKMVCAIYSTMKGFKFTEEYKSWYQKNERLSDEPAKYRIYYINHSYYSDHNFNFINQAIEYGKETGMEFRVELGEMVCCARDSITGLRFYGEYQTWKQNQEYILDKTEGSY